MKNNDLIFDYSKYQTKTSIQNLMKILQENPEIYNDRTLEKIFFKHLSTISAENFDRTTIPEVIEKKLRKIIGQEDQTNFINMSDAYKEQFEEARYYAALGCILKPSKGASDSHIIVNPKNNKKIGIYKPSSGETLSTSGVNIFTLIFRALLRFVLKNTVSANLEQTVSGKGYVAEVTTSLISQKVAEIIKKLNIQNEELDLSSFVPETQIVSFKLPNRNKESGSFQLWVNPKDGEIVKEAMDFFNTDKRYRRLSDETTVNKDIPTIPQELFDIMGVITFITGDADKKGDNWLVKLNNNGKVNGIQLIDGGWSMHPFHVESKLAPELNYQHCWKVLPNGMVGFSDLGKKVILGIYNNREDLIKTVRAAYEVIHEDTSITEQRVNLMLARLEALAYAASRGITLEKLANIRLKGEYQAIQEMIDETKDTREFLAVNEETKNSQYAKSGGNFVAESYYNMRNQQRGQLKNFENGL